MAKLFVNILDAANEAPLEGLNAMEWPTGATLPVAGERLRVHGHEDFQVVRRVFHLGLPTGDLVVDLFVGYAVDE